MRVTDECESRRDVDGDRHPLTYRCPRLAVWRFLGPSWETARVDLRLCEAHAVYHAAAEDCTHVPERQKNGTIERVAVIKPDLRRARGQDGAMRLHRRLPAEAVAL